MTDPVATTEAAAPAAPPAPPAPAGSPARPDVRERGEWEIRWRQTRNAPPPIVRAIVADLLVATVAGIALLAWDIVFGASLAAFVLYLATVVGAGSLLTYLWAPLPTGAGGPRRRSGWAAMLGFFAALPVAYIVLVVAFQVIRPFVR